MNFITKTTINLTVDDIKYCIVEKLKNSELIKNADKISVDDIKFDIIMEYDYEDETPRLNGCSIEYVIS